MTGKSSSSTRSAPFWSCMFDKMTRNSAFVKRNCSWKVTSSKSVILFRVVFLTDRGRGKRSSLRPCTILRHIRITTFQSKSVACTDRRISSTLPPVSVSDSIAVEKNLKCDTRKSLRVFLVRRTRSSMRIFCTASSSLRGAQILGPCRWHWMVSRPSKCGIEYRERQTATVKKWNHILSTFTLIDQIETHILEVVNLVCLLEKIKIIWNQNGRFVEFMLFFTSPKTESRPPYCL